jgi:hypothetical protein
VSSCPHGLEALRRYREERAKNPASEDQVVPPVEEQADDEDTQFARDEDDEAAEDEFEDLFEHWMERNIEFQFGSSDNPDSTTCICEVLGIRQPVHGRRVLRRTNG